MTTVSYPRPDSCRCRAISERVFEQTGRREGQKYGTACTGPDPAFESTFHHESTSVGLTARFDSGEVFADGCDERVGLFHTDELDPVPGGGVGRAVFGRLAFTDQDLERRTGTIGRVVPYRVGL